MHCLVPTGVTEFAHPGDGLPAGATLKPENAGTHPFSSQELQMPHGPQAESQDERRHEEDIKHHPHGEEAEEEE